MKSGFEDLKFEISNLEKLLRCLPGLVCFASDLNPSWSQQSVTNLVTARVLGNNFSLIARRSLHGFNCFVQLRIKHLTNSINGLHPGGGKRIFETRRRSPYAFRDYFRRATCFSGIGGALKIIEHRQ